MANLYMSSMGGKLVEKMTGANPVEAAQEFAKDTGGKVIFSCPNNAGVQNAQGEFTFYKNSNYVSCEFYATQVCR